MKPKTKQQPCTQCLDMLIDFIGSKQAHTKKKIFKIRQKKCQPKNLVKLLGKAIGRYEEQGLEIPIKYYKKYHTLMDKYEPDWRTNGLLYENAERPEEE